MRPLLAAALLAMPMLPATAGAQDYALSLDVRAQRVTYRGVLKDSLPAAQVLVGASGGFETPEGYAVTCPPGQVWCRFYRPGPAQTGAPLFTTADLSLWGIGLRGMSIHATARLGVGLGDRGQWPGTDPSVQVLEGYAQYASERLTVRLGRVVNRGRLGYEGYDGLRVAWHLPALGLTAAGYGGLGLARGAALPVTSEVLNPLDEFQPRHRQLVAGGRLEWRGATGDARLDYQREVDRDPGNWVSERLAVSAAIRPVRGWHLAGGAEYDLARRWWGSADLTLSWAGARHGGSAGVRRYQPYFDLWTIWGAFSPLTYTAITGTAWASPAAGLTLRASGERFWYPDADAETPLIAEATAGWRWALGGSYATSRGVSLDAGYHAAFGPGASSRGLDVGLSLRVTRALTLAADGGRLERPLEFRAADPAVTWVGLTAVYLPHDRLRLTAGAARYLEDRRRPDQSGLDWSQTRLRAAITWSFGSGADRLLPPGRRRETDP